MRLARVLGAIGRTLISAGVLILLFVAYQLWGTGLREAQAQNRLEDRFAEVLDDAEVPEPSSTSSTTSTTSVTTTTVPPGDIVPETVPPLEPVPVGDPTARIRIPEIGVDKIVVEGVALRELKKGPGHFPGSPLPGQQGNAAIAGHRTTYGAPFGRINELDAGDEILVETVQGEFRYLVQEQLIVAPSQVEVLEDMGDDRLTLVSCHPKYSARQRIVVTAVLAANQVALPVPPPVDTGEVDTGEVEPPPPPTTLDDLDGEEASKLPAILFGGLTALIWLLAWILGRVWRRWPAYALGLPFFAVSLFYFFEEFSRLLPASY